MGLSEVLAIASLEGIQGHIQRMVDDGSLPREKAFALGVILDSGVVYRLQDAIVYALNLAGVKDE